MNFLNKKSYNDCVQHKVLQKFTNFHAIRSWNFHNICNEIGWPRFLRHPVYSRDLLHLNDFAVLGSNNFAVTVQQKHSNFARYSVATDLRRGGLHEGSVVDVNATMKSVGEIFINIIIK